MSSCSSFFVLSLPWKIDFTADYGTTFIFVLK